MGGMVLDGETFDSIVTDPPYDLVSIVKRFGKAGAAPARGGVYARSSRGFMGKAWDGTGVAFDPNTWAAALHVLKPGGHLVAFGGSRTWHRMAVAIEDAGFEIRDTLSWMYGTGFPKSHDISRAIYKHLGAERTEGAREWTGGGRSGGILGDAAPNMRTILDTPATPEGAEWTGWGSALKPAWEPIILARRPLSGTLAENTLQHGVAGLNIDACRVDGVKPVMVRTATVVAATAMAGTSTGATSTGEYTTEGRWPPNVLHDGSPEVLAAFARFGESRSTAQPRRNSAQPRTVAKGAESARVTGGHEDSGSAARFFPALPFTDDDWRFWYSGKAGKADRAGSRHPTVKPVALMQWLCRLVTPPGGRILDPFAGSGTTLQAAHACGFAGVGIEQDPEYQADIRSRLALL